MKTMRGAWIDFDFRCLARRFQSVLHLLNLRDRDALIRLAVKSKHRRFHVRRELDRAFRPDRILRIDEPAIESDACFQEAAVGGADPHRSSAPAKTDDPQPRSIAALRLRPGYG